VLTGAFIQNGFAPGPRLFIQQPVMVWTIVASMFVGNLLLLILNVPLVGLWTRLLAVPYAILSALIFAFIIVGAFAVSASTFNIYVMILFGVVGWIFRRLEIPLAPLVLTLILGPMLEVAMRQSLQMSQGDFSIFVNRPIALVLLIVAVLVLVLASAGDRLTPRRYRALKQTNAEE